MNSVTDSAKVAIKSEESTPRRGYIFNNRAISPIPTHTIGSALGLGCKIQATKVQKHPPTHACLPLRRLSHRKSYHTIHATALTCAQHSVPTTQTPPPPYLNAPPRNCRRFRGFRRTFRRKHGGFPQYVRGNPQQECRARRQNVPMFMQPHPIKFRIYSVVPQTISNCIPNRFRCSPQNTSDLILNMFR